MKKSDKKQSELDGMSEYDTAAKLALRLKDTDHDISEAHKSRESLEEQLVETLEATDRTRITVQDYYFSIRYVKAQKKISVRKNTKKKQEE